MNTLTADYHFPTEVKTRHDVHQAVSKTTEVASKMAIEADEILQRLATEHNVVVPALFWLELIFTELFANIAHHDHLDLHGVQRERILGSEELEAHEIDLFDAKLSAARGCKSTIECRISATELHLTIELVRPFANFLKRWERAQSAETDTALDDPTGRGLVITANVFKEAGYHYDEQEGRGHLWFRCLFPPKESTDSEEEE
jgi:hypothetical protein